MNKLLIFLLLAGSLLSCEAIGNEAERQTKSFYERRICQIVEENICLCHWISFTGNRGSTVIDSTGKMCRP